MCLKLVEQPFFFDKSGFEIRIVPAVDQVTDPADISTLKHFFFQIMNLGDCNDILWVKMCRQELEIFPEDIHIARIRIKDQDDFGSGRKLTEMSQFNVILDRVQDIRLSRNDEALPDQDFDELSFTFAFHIVLISGIGKTSQPAHLLSPLSELVDFGGGGDS